MKKKINFLKKRVLAGSMVFMLSAGLLTGCGSDTKIVFTSGLSGNQLFKIGSSCCTMPEIMIYLTTFYNQYAEAYGEEMWQYDFGGLSLEEHVKDVVVSKMAQIKIMNLMAEEYDIVLDDEEKTRVQQAVKAYESALSDTLKKKEGITETVIETVFTEYTLANKVYSFITEAADMEISDDEARTVSVQNIYFKNWKIKDGEKISMTEKELQSVKQKVTDIMTRLSSGEVFETVAAELGEEQYFTKSYARGDVEAAFEEIIFSLDEGECSSLIEAEDGFYIVKCVCTMDDQATQENKLILAEQRKKDAFSRAYEEIAENTHSQFRDQLWEKLTLNKEIHSTTADFFEIYEEYIKQ